MTIHDELLSISARLSEQADSPALEKAAASLQALDEAARSAGKAFSGSWLGYHARVYYHDLEPPPAGLHFSQEWGLQDLSFSRLGSRGRWEEMDFDGMIASLRARAGNPDLTDVLDAANTSQDVFEESKSEIKSLIGSEKDSGTDAFTQKIVEQLDRLEPYSPKQLISHWSPKGQVMTRDMVAAGQGNQVPPHIVIKAEVASIRHAFAICAEAAKLARQAGSHWQRKSRQRVQADRIGTNVFIGHGRSLAWRELKDFLQDRLKLPWDEFNRVPVAGITNQARLAEMLDAASVALLIMTAEDESAEGKNQARMNVIHEVGLFQGRLGFTRAIVLLEDGCEEFSNIQGLGQIRFPSGKISAAFEEVRQVLEREGLIE